MTLQAEAGGTPTWTDTGSKANKSGALWKISPKDKRGVPLAQFHANGNTKHEWPNADVLTLSLKRIEIQS